MKAGMCFDCEIPIVLCIIIDRQLLHIGVFEVTVTSWDALGAGPGGAIREQENTIRRQTQELYTESFAGLKKEKSTLAFSIKLQPVLISGVETAGQIL
jgi:hypothetical protein